MVVRQTAILVAPPALRARCTLCYQSDLVVRPLPLVLLACCCLILGGPRGALVVPFARADEPAGASVREPAALKPPERPRLTLPELLQMARERSPIIAAARSQIAIRESQVREAWKSWYPSGEITFGISPAPEVQCLPPGVYIAMNGKVWNPARVRKNRAANRFEET